MYERLTVQMAQSIATFSRSHEAMPDTLFVDTTGAMVALETCLAETVKEIGLTSLSSRKADLHCIYVGISQLLQLLEREVQVS